MSEEAKARADEAIARYIRDKQDKEPISPDVLLRAEEITRAYTTRRKP